MSSWDVLERVRRDQMMAETMTTPEKKGLRRSLRKWKDKLKREKTATSATPAETTPPPRSPSRGPQDALFKPTTQTVIHSPHDPRNFQSSPNSNASSPANTLKKSPPNVRRNTAPADYFSSPSSTHLPAGPTAIPINTITTTITATSPGSTHNRRTSRLRLSFSKRSSVQALSGPPRAPSRATLRSHTPPQLSPAASAPNPLDHADKRATFQHATVAEMATQTERVNADVIEEAEVVRRDKPRDSTSSERREQEETEQDRKLSEEDGMVAKKVDSPRNGVEE